MASRRGSLETILTFENADVQNEWSAIWSTTQIPGMDNATGGGGQSERRLMAGRRRLRMGSLALAACLTMHCRVVASAVSGGCFAFMAFLVIAVAMLANPLRHFEVYLGQWSISGPGRAFRIIPMLDGIGIAICINAIVRAILCCVVAAVAAVYVSHSISDAELPFTYCRDFNLVPYKPTSKNVLRTRKVREAPRDNVSNNEYENWNEEVIKSNEFTNLLGSVGTVSTSYEFTERWNSLGIDNFALNSSNFTRQRKLTLRKRNEAKFRSTMTINSCAETYSGKYPSLFENPAHNFFYVEVMQLREDYRFSNFNIKLIISLVVVWLIIWMFMIIERIKHRRLIWNNIKPWFVAVPFIWSLVLLAVVGLHFQTLKNLLLTAFKVSVKETLWAISDALEVALYIHSASTGTELIHGKGLNHYAHGHVDANLNKENVCHSVLVLVLTGTHTVAASVCSLVDNLHPDNQAFNSIEESTLWVLPMYSKCCLVDKYSRFMSTLIFSGLIFSHMLVAYALLKTALHTIFEYRVKLVFVEQYVVAGLILTCMGLSVPFTTNGGVALLESVEALSSGVCVPLVCLLQLVAMQYVYRSQDFHSDMRISTEENTCSTRISTQWRIIPIVVLLTLLLKIALLTSTEIPTQFMLMAIAPVAAVVLAVPIRALSNYFVFLRPAPRHGHHYTRNKSICERMKTSKKLNFTGVMMFTVLISQYVRYYTYRIYNTFRLG